MKRILCFIIAVSMLPITAFAQASDWAKADVDKAYEMGIVPESFDEEWQKEITREEFAEGIVRTLAYSLDYDIEEFFEYVALADIRVVTVTSGEDSSFSIVSDGQKISFTDCDNRFVLLAADMGIVQGVGDGRFEPLRSIMREEAAVMLTRARYLCTATMGYSRAYFDDFDLVSDWAKKAVRHMKSSGVMQGVGENKFDPKGTYTREMAVITFVRFSSLRVSGGKYQMRPTLERIIEQYNSNPIYSISKTVQTDYGVVLVINTGGAMHTGGELLVFVTNDGREYSMSENAPNDTPWAKAHHDTMELSENGKSIIYTYSFDSKLVSEEGEQESVLHEKGTYIFVLDLVTGEVTYTVSE